mgnify:CR=1 FL=1
MSKNNAYSIYPQLQNKLSRLSTNGLIHLLNLITILQWYTEINRQQMRYLAQTLQIWHA